jgi:hypothetical protein
MSIIEDYTAIGSRLAELEKKPAEKQAEAERVIAESWMYYAPEQDTAPSEYVC